MTSLSPSVQAVLEVFQGALSDVRFADIDAAGLGALATEVENAAVAVQEQEAQLAALRQTLAQRQDALLVLAQRALAYARVYAEHDEALTEQLNRISLPRAAKPRKPGQAKSSEGDAVTTADAAPPESPAASAVAEVTPEVTAEVEAVEAPAGRKGKRRSSGGQREATA